MSPNLDAAPTPRFGFREAKKDKSKIGARIAYPPTDPAPNSPINRMNMIATMMIASATPLSPALQSWVSSLKRNNAKGEIIRSKLA